jgi:hypothetical protein
MSPELLSPYKVNHFNYNFYFKIVKTFISVTSVPGGPTVPVVDRRLQRFGHHRLQQNRNNSLETGNPLI